MKADVASRCVSIAGNSTIFTLCLVFSNFDSFRNIVSGSVIGSIKEKQMKKIVPICAAVAAAAMMLSISTPAMAMGGPSGPHVTYPVQGNIGEVIVNPYKGGTAHRCHP